MATIVGTKGQVVIEKPLRDALGIQPGSLAVQRRVGNEVVISFFEPTGRRSLMGSLALYARSFGSDAAREDAEERAWPAAVADEWREGDHDQPS